MTRGKVISQQWKMLWKQHRELLSKSTAIKVGTTPPQQRTLVFEK